ncbi:hypothetical protein TNCV_3065901 [Trichonephila clavipes]|uniref:Uncharacterized protein n=1 Tax=Trichonephila clavipes TaxID=2585209 RepID=A0A8X6RMP1_TRICX|nr:hypothetical protein TNCV_3065901 [Trichonephila clavipes]
MGKEDQIWFLVDTHVRALESDLKHQYLYQGSPKYVLLDSVLETEMPIPFVPDYDLEDNFQQPQLADFEHYHPQK